MASNNETSVDISQNEAEHETSPLDYRHSKPARALSFVSFSWAGSLIARSTHNEVNEGTLWAVCPEDTAENLSARVLGFWRQEKLRGAEALNVSDATRRKQSSEASFMHSTLLAFVATGAHWTGLILPAMSAVHILQAYSLGQMGSRIAGPSINGSVWTYAAALVVLTLIGFQLQNLYSFASSRTSMQLRTALVSAIFEKSSRIPLPGFQKTTHKQAANAILNEIKLSTQMVESVHYLWAGPLETIAALVVGCSVTLGSAFACGFALLVAISLSRLTCERRLSALKHTISMKGNERLQLTSQVLKRTYSVKMNGWENVVAEHIAAARLNEVTDTRHALAQQAINETLRICSPGFAAAVAFTLHVYCFGQLLSLEQVMSTLALYAMVHSSLTRFVLYALGNCSAAQVSMQRIQRFLELPDAPLPPAAQTPPPAAVRRRRRALAQRALRKAASKTKTLAKNTLGGFSATLGDLAEGCEDEAEDSDGADLFADRMEDLLPCDDDFPPPPLPSAGWDHDGYPRRWRSLSLDGDSSASETDVSESDGEWGASVHALLGHVPVLEVYSLNVSLQDQDKFILMNTMEDINVNSNVAEFSDRRLKSKEPNTREQVLRDVSFECRLGEVVIVLGPEGSGKSSLLLAILGELLANSAPKAAGTRIDSGAEDTQLPAVMVLDPDQRDDGPVTPRRVVYLGQDLPVVNGSLRACVTYGESFDLDLYNACLAACQLIDVVKMLPFGDRTNMSDSDVVLSSSQQKCLVLARCCYSALCRDDVHLVLLDDPFLVFSQEVASELFDAVIGGPRALLRHKAVVLCTGQVQYLHSPAVGRILVLDQSGCVAAYGPFLQVRLRIETLMGESCGGGMSRRVINRTPLTVDTSDDLKAKDMELRSTFSESKQAVFNNKGTFDQEVDFAKIGGELESSKDDKHWPDVEIVEQSATIDDYQPHQSTIIVDEHLCSVTHRNSEPEFPPGSNLQELSWETCKMYASMTTGTGTAAWLVVLIIATRVVAMAVPAWIVQWSFAQNGNAGNTEDLGNDMVNTGDTTDKEQADAAWQQDGSAWICGLAALTIAAVLLFFACAYCVLIKLCGASEKLHDLALRHILQAPVELLHDMPHVRSLGCFHKDAETLDDTSYFFFYFLQCFVWCTIVLMLAVAANLPVIAAVAPLSAMFLRLYRYSEPCNRSLNHLEAKSRRQIGRHLVEVMLNRVAIRAARQDEYIRSAGFKVLDANTRANFALLAQTHWLGYRIDALCTLLLAACTFAATLTSELTDESAYEPTPMSSSSPLFFVGNGLLVLSLLYVMLWSEKLGIRTVRHFSKIETRMASTKQLLEFAQLPKEAALCTETSTEAQDGTLDIYSSDVVTKMSSSSGSNNGSSSNSSDNNNKPSKREQKWPKVGTLEVRDLCAEWSNASQPIMRLHGISFTVQPGERVGVVGHSGSGVSILVAALLRLIEPASGCMTLDGVDVATISRHELRRAISVVSETPLLLIGTLRFNLDPLSKHSEAQIWRALSDVQMAAKVATIPGDLDAMVGDDDANFSAGERQLLYLARAILQDTKVIILDQLGGNMNEEISSNRRLQEVVRTKFNHCSVLAIADQVFDVIDCNCVIVLDQGRVIRQGPPQDLLLTTPFIESRANVASPKHTSGAKNTDIDSGIGDGVVSNTDRASTGGIDTIFDF